MGTGFHTSQEMFSALYSGCSIYNEATEPPNGQQARHWLIPRTALADLFHLPRLPELMREAIKTIFQPRWRKGRWRSKT